MSALGHALVRRKPDGEIQVGFPFHGRGTVRVNGALWQYVRSDSAVLAAESLPQFKGAMGRFDDPAVRATVQAQLGCACGPSLFEGTGKALREVLATITRALGSDPNDLPQQPVGFVAGTDPPRTIDVRFLHIAEPFVRDTEALTLTPVDNHSLRLDAPRVRLCVAQLQGDPVLVIGGEIPADKQGIDGDRLATDRAYALAMARDLTRHTEQNLDRGVLREAPPCVALAAAGEIAREHDALDDAMALREIAHACGLHGITWAEIDAGRVLS